MSTSALILVPSKDNSENEFIMSRVHYDATPMFLGKDLNHYFNDWDDALDLVNGGEISSIDEDVVNYVDDDLGGFPKKVTLGGSDFYHLAKGENCDFVYYFDNINNVWEVKKDITMDYNKIENGKLIKESKIIRNLKGVIKDIIEESKLI